MEISETLKAERQASWEKKAGMECVADLELFSQDLHGLSQLYISLGESSLSLVLFLFRFTLDYFSLFNDLAHGLHPQHCHDLLGSVSTVEWQ